jgi:hypothetical protein
MRLVGNEVDISRVSLLTSLQEESFFQAWGALDIDVAHQPTPRQVILCAPCLLMVQ